MPARDLTVLGEIARGGFGRVERVRGPDGVVLARKVFDPSPLLGSPEELDVAKLRKRFEREVRVQMALARHGMMPIVLAELASDPPFFLMPLAEKNYRDQIRDDRQAGRITTEPLLDILSGLEELHRLGYVHRDLKPDNVLLHEGTWRLCDFGLVADVEKQKNTQLTSTASVWGSRLYMAPELTLDFRRARPTADIYAFGCILHDLVDGGSRIPYAVQVASGPFDAIVRKCTAADPKRRFQSIAGLRAALVDVLKRNPGFPRSEATREWSEALGAIASWTDEMAFAFAAHVERAQPGDEECVVAEVTEEHLDAIASRFPDEWDRIALAYCDWAGGTFTFRFCDVVVGRLEWIFKNERSSLDARAAALVSAAVLGAVHNRWLVMRRVMRMADATLDESLAERIAVEIQAAGAEERFLACAECINRSATDFHPRIVEIIVAK
jgi:serine/threonine protein kinase